jgi:hypothetical protein
MKTIRIYSDESRHRNKRFLLLGGLWVEENNVQAVEDGVRALRAKHGYTNSVGKHVDFLGEFKWKKVSDKYLSTYKELVDLFFECISSDTLRSCIMLVDTQDKVVIAHSNIKKEGYFKLLYQLYYHNSRTPAQYKIYPDRITNSIQRNVNFENLDKCLEAAFKKKFLPLLNPTDTPSIRGFVNNITPIESKLTPFIQIIDVIMGSIGYYQNGLFKNSKAKKSKVELMEYILNKIVLSGSFKFTGKKYMIVKSTKLNIWLFKPKNKKDSQ